MNVKSVFFALMLLAGPAVAQSTNRAVSVDVQVLQEVAITDVAGNKLLERRPVGVATPNQEIIYKISVKNSDRSTANNVVLNIPISESITVKSSTFVSDIPMTVLLSSDGATFHKKSHFRDGDDQIRALRVDIPELPRGETYFLEYDAVIN